MRKQIILILAFSLVLKPITLLAWGHEGHKIIADIAQSQMNPNIIDSVQKYLGATTFEEASCWLDNLRNEHQYDYMKPWHFINIGKGQTYTPEPGDKNCVTELQRAINELENRSNLSPDQINFDIKVIFHLVGDLHQPLHCGYKSDKGGNAVEVEFLNKKSNLHKVWDTEIIYKQYIKPDNCSNSGKPGNIKTIDVLAWLNESRQLLPNVYNYQNGIIDHNYINENVPIIEKQLYLAGSRLALILNTTFSK